MFNCRASAQDKMAFDKLELDLSAESVSVTYVWSAMRLINNSRFEPDVALSNTLGNI